VLDCERHLRRCRRAGVQQAFNVASLKGVTDSTTATACSTAQQLVTTAWDILLGIVTLV
jgi:hypothetical protein